MARLIVSCMVEALVALVVAAVVSDHSPVSVSTWAVVTTLGIFTIEIHESAHALVCVALGGTVRGIGVGRAGAFTRMVPGPTWVRQRWRPIAMIAAGPFVGIAFGGGLVLGASGWIGPPSAWVIGGWVAIVGSVYNLLPLRLMGMITDGGRIVGLLQSHESIPGSTK
ncbi:MAG: hypothetical protein QOG80_1439 [Pseudonocardiales bacterium]|jgi:hypothetical protein|nr:hypothetical protein [Pseudonocardiales bacterium]